MLHVLVATDGSPGARAAVDYTASVLLGRTHVDQLTLLAVLEPFSLRLEDVVLVPQHTWDELDAVAKEQAEAALQEATGALGQFNGALRTLARSGDVAQQITRTAQEIGADMIVIGSHRWGELRALLFGSVEHGVVDQAPCPVLVVHERQVR